jgi:type VI secretion system protein ImpG
VVRREQDGRYQAYLDQLQSLGEFRLVHGERHPGASINEEDPAVSRIIEALAYFSVGTQLAAQNNMRASLERLLAGYFDFLLAPMPAMAMLQLAHSERLIDMATLREGAQLVLTAPDGSTGNFRTMHELPIAPAQLERTEVLVLEDGFRVLLPLRAQFPVRGLAGPLHLQVHYLDRYVAALRLVHNLRKHLRGVSAFFDERPSDGRPGAPCEVRLGAVAGSATVCGNPLERVRLMLHYPELELAAQVTVPDAPRPWTRLTLAFDLDSKWPDSRAAANDPFVLHAVPLINLQRAPAAAIACDGLRTVHPLVPNERDHDLVMASLVGVYELGSGRDGLTPIPPAGLPGASEGYEIERVHTQTGVKYRLILRLLGAFAKPRSVVAEADWHQPWFSARAVGPLRVLLADRHIEGVQFKLLGALRPHADSPLAQLSSALLELLAMRMKPTLRLSELVAILRLLGVDEESPFSPLLGRLRELTVDSSPDPGGRHARFRYRLRLDPIAPGDEALTWTLVARIRELLEAWSDGGAVGVEVDVDTSESAAQANRRDER